MRELNSQELWGAEKLESELEVARDGLRGLDRSIRKILGRDLPESESGPLQPPRLDPRYCPVFTFQTDFVLISKKGILMKLLEAC